MDYDFAFSVAYPDPDEALQALERARFELECLMDYVAANHPQKISAQYLEELVEYLEEEAEVIVGKYGLQPG